MDPTTDAGQHEYDLGPGFVARASAEPGLPDEMVSELAAEPVAAYGLNLELLAENSPIVLMVLVAIAMTETTKQLGLRLLIRRRGWSQDVKDALYRAVLFIVSATVAQTLGFRTLVIDVTGVQLSWAESILYGGGIVSVLAAVVYSMRLVKAGKAWIYSRLGTTTEAMESSNGNSE